MKKIKPFILILLGITSLVYAMDDVQGVKDKTKIWANIIIKIYGIESQEALSHYVDNLAKAPIEDLNSLDKSGYSFLGGLLIGYVNLVKEGRTTKIAQQKRTNVRYVLQTLLLNKKLDPDSIHPLYNQGLVSSLDSFCGGKTPHADLVKDLLSTNTQIKEAKLPAKDQKKSFLQRYKTAFGIIGCAGLLACVYAWCASTNEVQDDTTQDEESNEE